MSLNKDNNFMSFVVYAGKSVDTTISFLQSVDTFCYETFSKYEFVVLNDSIYSPDEIEKLQKISFKGSTQINIVNMSFHQGLEKAMNAGVDFAIGDYVFEFDTINVDYSLDEILNVYRKCLDGADIVSANPGKNRRLSSAIFYGIFNRFSNNQYKISSNTFFLLSRRAINRIKNMSVSIPYRKAVYSNCGLVFFNYVYKPIKKRRKEEFKKDKREVVADSFVLYTKAFFGLALFFTLTMTLLSTFSLVYTIVIYLTKEPAEGWTTMMLLMSIGFFAVFVFMLIILIYLKIIVNLSFQKQEYLVESVKKGNKE